MQLKYFILKIRKALAGIDPENRIAADVPAGMLPMNGWLSQMHLCLHSSQNWIIRTNEPITTFLIFLVMAVQYTQVLKSNNNDAPNTRYAMATVTATTGTINLPFWS